MHLFAMCSKIVIVNFNYCKCGASVSKKCVIGLCHESDRWRDVSMVVIVLEMPIFCRSVGSIDEALEVWRCRSWVHGNDVRSAQHL